MFKMWLLLILLTLPFYAKSSVWKISNENNASIYVGGTIHLLRESDYPLPKEYNQSYQESDIIVFETDIKDESMSEYVTQAGLYPKGVELKDKLTPATYQALEAYTQKTAFPLILITRMRASLAMFSLVLHKYQTLGFHVSNGIDLHFFERAQRDNKPILTFETPKEQVDMLLAIGEGEEDELVKYTLIDLEQLESYFLPLIKAWRVGDRTLMKKTLLKELQKYPKIYQSLLVQRNQKWLKSMQTYFDTPAIELILVGSAHLIGEDGLLHYFEKNGYKVEQVQ